MPSELAATVNVRLTASPWGRVVTGPQRGWSFRDVHGRRLFARGDAAKVKVDAELRAHGFMLHSAPAGYVLETDEHKPKAPASQRVFREG